MKEEEAEFEMPKGLKKTSKNMIFPRTASNLSKPARCSNSLLGLFSSYNN
jgi:hypothetical protein